MRKLYQKNSFNARINFFFGRATTLWVVTNLKQYGGSLEVTGFYGGNSRFRVNLEAYVYSYKNFLRKWVRLAARRSEFRHFFLLRIQQISAVQMDYHLLQIPS